MIQGPGRLTSGFKARPRHFLGCDPTRFSQLGLVEINLLWGKCRRPPAGQTVGQVVFHQFDNLELIRRDPCPASTANSPNHSRNLCLLEYSTTKAEQFKPMRGSVEVKTPSLKHASDRGYVPIQKLILCFVAWRISSCKSSRSDRLPRGNLRQNEERKGKRHPISTTRILLQVTVPCEM